jgi:hypothetical protein
VLRGLKVDQLVAPQPAGDQQCQNRAIAEVKDAFEGGAIDPGEGLRVFEWLPAAAPPKSAGPACG